MVAVGSFDAIEKFFAFCAIAGGLLVAIRFGLMFMGSDTDADVGHFDLDVHAEGGGDDFHAGADTPGGMHVDADQSLRLFSLHNLSAFFLMFGLVGLAIYRARPELTMALVGASTAGFVSVWILSYIFMGFHRMQGSGTIDLKQAVGCEGRVYLTIPASGVGRVTVNIGNRMMELDARSSDGLAISTDTSVRVTAINVNILTVERLAHAADK